eukprot:TRINITY_DN5166_c0_g3_i1.p1 TRINITY_DN5166_c0_g3~~TRINITY_DN5166_c0_g3_i1.p1  ORF type:complete len:367 (+),score=40.49 TRINITY_DN5166_c0_g3_i1:213-1313(+)
MFCKLCEISQLISVIFLVFGNQIISQAFQSTQIIEQQWNPLIPWCDKEFPNQKLNLSTIQNDQGNFIQTLQCGSYLGAMNNKKLNTNKDNEQLVEIRDYQKTGIDLWMAILKYHGFKIEEGTTILDHGADVSGHPLHYVVSQTGSLAVGYNVFGFYKENQVQSFITPHENISMVLGEIGSPLPFKWGSFNVVISSNVLEHVGDYKTYIRESVRVLKHKGALYLEWNPQYYGKYGHHVHGGMVKGWWEEYKCVNNTQINDWYYQWVGKWDHFLKTPEGLKEELMQGPLGSCEEVVDELVRYVYDKNDLNQVPFEEVLRFFRRLPDVDILTVEISASEVPDKVEETLTRKLGEHELGVNSVWVLAQKR